MMHVLGKIQVILTELQSDISNDTHPQS
jgi:hypothetical protein